MVTMHQLVTRNIRICKKSKRLLKALKSCPFKKGIVQKTVIQTPKKPNSAKRKVCKVKLTTGRIITCHIPGEKHSLTKHAEVLVRGGRCQDLIGVRYKTVRGKFNLSAVKNRKTRLTKYGVKKIK
jgi:small subunit ribosomal protein S12